MSIVASCELIVWRSLEPQIRDAVETLLALNGDRATDELKKLHSDLVQIEVERRELKGGHE